MSATESVYGNPRALAYDPWIENGLAEDSLQDMVAPYIDSARDGVKYLGNLIKNMVLQKEMVSCLQIRMKFGTWKL